MNTFKRIVWLHDGDHFLNPFICLGADTLVDAGYKVYVLNRGIVKGKTRYHHIPLGDKHHYVKNITFKVSYFFKKLKNFIGMSEHIPSFKKFPQESSFNNNSIVLQSENELGTIGNIKNKLNSFRSTATNKFSRWEGNLWNKWFLLKIFIVTLSKRPEIIIATLPTVGTIGWLISRVTKSRLVYYPFELYGDQHNSVPVVWKLREKRLLSRGIHALITQNEERAKIYKGERGARINPIIIPNYKNSHYKIQKGKLRNLLKISENTKLILYEGNLINGRWLDKLVLSSQYFPENFRLVFMGRETSWWKENVHPYLRTLEIGRKIIMVEWKSQQELVDYVSDADLGVIIYDNNCRNNFFCAPGKLSDYIMAKVPVVAPNFPTIDPIIKKFKIGETFNSPDPEEIARTISKILKVPKIQWEPALNRAKDELCWEKQIPKFLEAVIGND